MYQLVSAIGKVRAVGGRWSNLQIGNTPMIDLYERYEKLYAVLSNPHYESVRCLDLQDIRYKYLGSSLTFNEVLAQESGNSLPTTAQIPKFKTTHAIYSDAVQARYKITPVSPAAHPQAATPPAERHWLALTREDTDYSLFFRSCLASVNGLIHLTDADSQRAYVVDGMKTARYSGKASLGLISFREVGALEFIPIKTSMIFRAREDLPLADRMYLNLGVSRPTKTAMLVLGGYLHALDNEAFYRINDTTFAINFKHIPLRDRYFDSRDLMDLSSLGLASAPGNSHEIDNDELFSDEVLTRYATLSQSFIVFVDNPQLFVETISVRESSSANMAVSFSAPHWPMLTETGKLVNYWRVHEHGQWACSFEDGLRDNYNFNDSPQTQLHGIDDHRLPYQQVTYPRMRMLRIGSDIQYMQEV